VVFEMVSVEAMGGGGVVAQWPLPEGPGGPLDHLTQCCEGKWSQVSLFDRAAVSLGQQINGPVVIK
jgi:hypothetical protein